MRSFDDQAHQFKRKGKVEFLSLVYDATILQLWQKGYQYPVLAQVADIYLAHHL